MTERRDLPLFRWGEAHRAARIRRLTRRVTRRRLGAGAIGICCLMATIVLPSTPRLVWNASASAPIGLYRVTPGAALERGDMVIAWAPAGPRALAAERHYLPGNVPLVKRVKAVAGERVCARGRHMLVEGRRIATRRTRDGAGRPLPWWRGCTTLTRGQWLLMMDAPDSFDGRYFGPTAEGDVIGKATPLWLR